MKAQTAVLPCFMMELVVMRCAHRWVWAVQKSGKTLKTNVVPMIQTNWDAMRPPATTRITVFVKDPSADPPEVTGTTAAYEDLSMNSLVSAPTPPAVKRDSLHGHQHL